MSESRKDAEETDAALSPRPDVGQGTITPHADPTATVDGPSQSKREDVSLTRRSKEPGQDLASSQSSDVISDQTTDQPASVSTSDSGFSGGTLDYVPRRASQPPEAGDLRVERLKSAFYEAKGSLGASKGKYVEFMVGTVTPDAVRYLHHVESPPEYIIVNCISCPSEAVAEFGKLPSVKVLHLAGGVKLDDKAVASLTTLPDLEVLTLILYDEDAEKTLATYLPKFRALKNLEIGGVSVNNRIIDTIVALPNLESLGLRLSRVDDAGLAELHHRRPDLTIFSDNRHPLRGDNPKDLKIIPPTNK
jgi:hypothetical protein